VTDTPAIIVDDVSKRFRVYKNRPSSLKERVTHFARDRYDEFWAIKGISLEIPSASVYGLVGHNGSGKSSLLRLMAGIHRPTRGHITTHGRISALLELGAGFHPDLTGRENVYLNAAILGFGRRETDALFDEIVEFSGLMDFIDAPVKHYSSGMYVRLGFSVAVHVNPQILLIDEVIAVGDEEFQRRCFEHLYRLRRSGVTIVMVTHNLGLVQAMCDRAAWLDHGQLLAEGTGPAVVKEYLSRVNEIEAERFEEAERAAEAAELERLAVEEKAAVAAAPVAALAERPVLLGKIEIFDRSGKPTRIATTGEPLTFRVHFLCRREVEEPLFSFAVENENGVLVANPGMRRKQEIRRTAEGDGFVDYAIESLALGPGEYQFTFAAHDAHGTMVLDKRERAATLRVQSGDEVVLGLVDLQGRWQGVTGEAREIA